MSLKLMLEEAADRYGSRTAVTSGDIRLSYTDLDRASNKVASVLHSLGVAKGDRVAMLLSSTPEFVTVYFGIVKTGAIAVPLDIKYKLGEVTTLLNDCRPKVLMAETQCLEPLKTSLPKFDFFEHVIDIDSAAYKEMVAAGSPARLAGGPAPDYIAQIAYASGPSFDPRGVVLTHRNLVISTRAAVKGFEQTEKDVVLLYIMPLHHMFALVAELFACIITGSKLVMVPGTGLSIDSVFATIEREKGTMLLGVPYVFSLAVETAEKDGIKHDLSSLRLCISAGAPLPLETVHTFKRHYGHWLLDCWGLTETICHVSCGPVDGSSKFGSIGRALQGWQVWAADDEGRELPPGEEGELIVRGPLMEGYYNNPRATAEMMRDGVLHTGDIGRVDEDGYIFITGRKRDMIIIKGQNVFPSDIEFVLSTHPRVAGVAALGIPDGLRGEIVGAVVSLKDGQTATEQELKKYCIERMANYKAPKQVIFVKSLPRDCSGRVDKEVLRRQLEIPPVFPKVAVP